jgi:hypothetical protein
MVNGLGAMLTGMTAINTKPSRPPVTPPPVVALGNPVVNGNIAVGKANATVNARNASGSQQRKTIVVASSEEEYETTDAGDAEDSGWASEDMDAEDKAHEAEKVKLSEAALEAQRQLDMFAKVPKRSYSNLGRTQSGLLSQLLNPDPMMLPPDHSYRLSHSTADIVRMQRQAQRQAQQVQAPQRSSSGFAGPVRLQTSKSSAALPLAAQITAMSSSKPSSGMKGKESQKGGYRPKERPKEEDMEDESAEDDDNVDDDDDKIQVSRSVAQQKLQALMSRRAPEPGVASHLAQHTRVVEHHVSPIAPATAPIPLGHPYNLPAPTPPMTPRTTRRRMLKQELSESMRRQLLWERQVSSTTNPAATARRANNSALSGLRPLASTTSDLNPGVTATKSAETEDKDERKRRAMARNRSWADDYHYSGWWFSCWTLSNMWIFYHLVSLDVMGFLFPLTFAI